MKRTIFGAIEVFDGKGSAIGADSAPPAAIVAGSSDRAIKIPEMAVSTPKITLFAVDGTTISGTPWAWEPTLKVWIPLVPTGSPIVATPAAPGSATVFPLDYAFVFMQLTANTLVTKAAWFYG